VDEPTVDARQKKTVEEFVAAIAHCQSIAFVAITKPENGPAQFRTGGYKGPGPTMVDMARSYGALAAELANVLQEASTRQGLPTTYEKALDSIMAYIRAGADTASFKSSTTRVVDGRRNG
jgi:hypothetical protein